VRKRYSVRSITDTLVGVGARAGTRAVEIRFTGCNMWDGNPDNRDQGRGACAQWCDADFQQGLATNVSAHQICSIAEGMWVGSGTAAEKWVWLTGGEPLLQVDAELLAELRDWGFSIAVETNGTVKAPMEKWPAEDIDHMVVAPQLLRDGTVPELEITRAHELKVVLPGWTPEQLMELEQAGEWKSRYVVPRDPTDRRTVTVSHLRGGYSDAEALDVAVNECIQWVRMRAGWRLGLQMDKILNL